MSTTETYTPASFRYPSAGDEVVCIKHPMRAGVIESIKGGMVTVYWTSHGEKDTMTFIQWSAAFDWQGNGWYLAG